MIGQIFTPISLMKKVFRLGERSLAREEISHRLEILNSGNSLDFEQIIQAALDEANSPFQEGSSKAIIEFQQKPSPVAEAVSQILNKMDTGAPMTEEQLLRRLRSKNKISWSLAFERIGLLADHRFSQLVDGRWLLTNWEFVNDEVYHYLTEHETTQVPRREIAQLLDVKMGYRKKKCLFLPEYDQRFQIDQTSLAVLSKAPVGNASEETRREEDGGETLQTQANAKEDKSFMEVAAAMSQVVEAKKTIVDEVVDDLMGALIKLEQRSNEMKDEVVGHFSSNNLEAIKGLMSEKEKNETVLSKLKEIVDELT
ncbi:hypothetical protein BEP19_00705 [Ammoniphilus oxalaticus]|uniref:Uncharacterized protein n=1 Tax=Ammoniphilus oxalaticus TaxID=66863 RepID=A0A419SRT0_9BACL|nr:hypothetical protein [Ammoniphilus oxalaticus]RKD27121.1 hypothetical protein BEP19_00705 [Ammoniphilus oxalaticus]